MWFLFYLPLFLRCDEIIKNIQGVNVQVFRIYIYAYRIFKIDINNNPKRLEYFN